jgi:hypothetical protein
MEVIMKKLLSGIPLLGALAAALCLPVQAEQVFKGKNLSEKNLVEALEPSPAVDAGAPEGGEVRTRSITVVRDQPSSKVAEQVAKAPARKPSAAVLITFVTDSADLAGHARS